MRLSVEPPAGDANGNGYDDDAFSGTLWMQAILRPRRQMHTPAKWIKRRPSDGNSSPCRGVSLEDDNAELPSAAARKRSSMRSKPGRPSGRSRH